MAHSGCFFSSRYGLGPASKIPPAWNTQRFHPGFPVVDFDHHQPPAASIDPVGKRVARAVLERVANGCYRRQSGARSRSPSSCRDTCLKGVGIHPLGDAHIASVGQVFAACAGIVKELFPAIWVQFGPLLCSSTSIRAAQVPGTR
jgi:hypothetical protein